MVCYPSGSLALPCDVEAWPVSLRIVALRSVIPSRSSGAILWRSVALRRRDLRPPVCYPSGSPGIWVNCRDPRRRIFEALAGLLPVEAWPSVSYPVEIVGRILWPSVASVALRSPAAGQLSRRDRRADPVAICDVQTRPVSLRIVGQQKRRAILPNNAPQPKSNENAPK